MQLKLVPGLSQLPNLADTKREKLHEILATTPHTLQESRTLELVENLSLRLTPVKFEEQAYWSYTRAELLRDDKLVLDYYRNYSSVEHKLINHSNKTSYLWTSEDYQGYTVINLSTDELKTYIPPLAEKGSGFCITGVQPNESGNWIAAVGCFWACPYQFFLIDFSNPDQFPYNYYTLESEYDYEEFNGWKDKDVFEASWIEYADEMKESWEHPTLFKIVDKTIEKLEDLPKKEYEYRWR